MLLLISSTSYNDDFGLPNGLGDEDSRRSENDIYGWSAVCQRGDTNIVVGPGNKVAILGYKMAKYEHNERFSAYI